MTIFLETVIINSTLRPKIMQQFIYSLNGLNSLKELVEKKEEIKDEKSLEDEIKEMNEQKQLLKDVISIYVRNNYIQ